MSDPLNQIELISTLSVPRYAPRLQPTIIPGAAWNDAPLFCLKLNDEWVSHVLGVMAALDQPDTWLGTAEEIYAARQQVNEIMVAFMTMCDDCEVQFRVEDCDLQWRENSDADWISIGNVCGADGVPGTPGTDGIDGTNGVDGGDGTNGSNGTNGVDGIDGVDGTDCDCDTYPPPTPPEGQEDTQTSCNIAGNIVDVILKDCVQAMVDNVTLGRTISAGIFAIVTVLGAVASAGAAIPIITAIGAAAMGALFTYLDFATDALADDPFWADLRCVVYCALKPNSDIDATIQSTIGAAIRASDYVGTGYTASIVVGIIADFFEGLPLSVIRSNAIIGAWGAYDCSGCTDCPEEELPQIFFTNNSGGCEPIEPDGGGIYTVTCDVFASGGYYGNISTYDTDLTADYSQGMEIVVDSLSCGGESVRLDQGTGAVNSLSSCYALIQFQCGASWTMTFHVYRYCP